MAFCLAAADPDSPAPGLAPAVESADESAQPGRSCSSSPTASRSSPIEREALTSTTSPGRRPFCEAAAGRPRSRAPSPPRPPPASAPVSSGRAPSPTAITCSPSAAASRPAASCSAALWFAQLQHLAEDGDPAALAAHGGQRLQPGAHRVRGWRCRRRSRRRRRPARRCTSILQTAGRRGRGQRCTRSPRWRHTRTPGRPWPRRGVAHVMGADAAVSRDLAPLLSAVTRLERGSCRVVQPDTLGARTSSRRRPAETHHPGPGARGHRRRPAASSVLSTAPTCSGGQRLDQLAPWSRAVVCRLAELPGVRSPDVQHDPDARAARSSASVADVAWSPGTPSRAPGIGCCTPQRSAVSGAPSSLLNEARSRATVGPRRLSSAAIEVLGRWSCRTTL